MDNWISLAAINLWDSNPNEGDIGAIMGMIERFGFRNPIGLNADTVTKNGNHRVMALRNLKKNGWQPFGPCIQVSSDGDWFIQYVDNRDLSAEAADMWGVADNRATRLGRDDIEILVQHLDTMQAKDRLAVGYDEEDVIELHEALERLRFEQTEEIDFDEFANTGDVNLRYRVIVDNLSYDAAQELSQTIPNAIVKQYRIKEDSTDEQ